MPSLKQIRYFLTIADLGGFTPAAAALYVAQPALSRQVAQLEAELGFALFEREPRGVRLTPAGALYRGRVAAVQALLNAAGDEGRQLAQGEAGVVRLLHSSSIPASSLMGVLNPFLAERPGARIDLDRVASDQQITEVACGRADLGLVRLPVLRHDTRVTLQPLPPEALWLALPALHPWAGRASVALTELNGQPLVSAVHRERGGLARRVTDLCLSRGFSPSVARVVSRKTAMLDLVAAGHGVAVVPERMRTQTMPGVVHVALHDPDATAHSALVLPRQPLPLAQALAAALAQDGAPDNPAP